jgi:uncharacterized membrane protein YccC
MTPPRASGTRPHSRSSWFRSFCAFCLDVTRRDPFRSAAQTILAVLISYNAAQWLRLSEPSWAVFSALYVIQGSVGGTLTAARDRVLGAVLGSLVALGCIHLIGLGGWRTILCLLAGIGIMSLITGVRPRYSYGLVPVAILIIAPGVELLENAVHKIGAIALGATAGAAASVLILPRQAHRSAEQHLAKALEGCGELLSACMAGVLAQDAPDLRTAHDRIARELAAAGTMIEQTRLRRKRRRHVPLTPLLKQIERLWYSLAMADRLSARCLPEPLRDHLGEPVRNATRDAERFLGEIGQALADGTLPARVGGIRSPASGVAAAVEQMRSGGLFQPLPQEDVEQVFGLSLAWQQLSRNMNGLLEVAGDSRDGTAAA